MKMDLDIFYLNLRSELLEIITGVKNSEPSLYWDTTTTNYSTKTSLESLLGKSFKKTKEYGLLLIKMHASCSNPNHLDYTNPSHSDLAVSNNYGLTIHLGDEEYIWEGDELYQGERFDICPCSKNNDYSEHYVMCRTIYQKGADIKQYKKIESILMDISEAIDCAEDNKPRSGIREYLLRAIIKINDELLPFPMDKYLDAKFNGN